jgi:hypothetical protein
MVVYAIGRTSIWTQFVGLVAVFQYVWLLKEAPDSSFFTPLGTQTKSYRGKLQNLIDDTG